jgi:hypothetical protein
VGFFDTKEAEEDDVVGGTVVGGTVGAIVEESHCVDWKNPVIGGVTS